MGSAGMFLPRSATMSQDRSARMFPDSSARTSQGSSVAMFPDSSARTFPGNSAPLLNLPMANNFAGLFYLKGSKLQYYAHIPQNLSLQREIIHFSNPQLYYLLTISIYLYSPSHWH